MILRDYLEAEDFLNESLFDTIIEEPINEAFKSDIARKISKSSVFRNYPEAKGHVVPSMYKDGEKISKGEKAWRKDIGKTVKGKNLYSKLFKVKLDQLEDSDFTLISKADARRKKYADGFIFWMDDNDEVAAISTGNYIELNTGRSSVFTGKILGVDDDFDPEGKDVYGMVYGDHYTNDKGEEIKYEKAYKRVLSLDKTNTLNLQKNPYIEYCYFLPFSVTNTKKSTRAKYYPEPSNDNVRLDNIERYEKEKVNRRKAKSKDCLPEYDTKFKSLLVKPMREQLKKYFDEVDSVKGGIDSWSKLLKCPNSIARMDEFFRRYSSLITSLDKSYFYNMSNATSSYEANVREEKENMEKFFNSL